MKLLVFIPLTFSYCLSLTTSRTTGKILRPHLQPTRRFSNLYAEKVGFIGCGTIASAIATGIAGQNKISVESIAVSRRSVTKSTALAKQLAPLVSVYDSHQDLLDDSNLIFLCVLPQHASQVLQELRFNNSQHTLVSLVVSIG